MIERQVASQHEADFRAQRHAETGAFVAGSPIRALRDYSDWAAG
jgi:hypothetical protein